MSWIELVAQRHPPTAPQGATPPENAKDWFRIENSADDPDATDVLIYSSIGGWFGMWADEFVDELKAVTTSKINLRLNSPGGSVFDGIAIANAIRSHPATVTVYVDSLAASIASVIAMSGDRLVMMPQSQIMVHNASGGCYGDASDMTKMADLLDKQSRNICEAYAQHTGGTVAEWQQYMDDETWFTADEALAVGLADEVVPMRKVPKEATPADARMTASWDLSMYRYPGRIGAPTPKVTAKKQETVTVQLGDTDMSEHMAAVAKQFAPGQRITAELANGVQLQPGELIVASKLVSELSTDELQELIAQTVREQLLNGDPPPWLKPKKGDDEDEEDDDEDEKNASTDEPEDEADPDEEPAAAATTDVAPPADDEDNAECVESIETFDQATDNGFPFLALLDSPTSPSADDVFSQLKEGW